MLRNVLAVVAGVVLGGVINMALVMIGPSIIPPPAGVDMTSTEGLRAGMHLLEPQHFIMPFLAHAIGTLVGAFTAYMIATSHRVRIAMVIGVFFLAGGIGASMMIPAPTWFKVLDIVVAYLPMAWLGTRIGRRLDRAPAAAPAVGI